MTTESRDPIADIRHNLGLMGPQFKAVFPTQAHVDRFIRVVMTAVQQNVKLAEPHIRTHFYAACMKCAQDGLMPDGKEAALVPYVGGRNPTVQYQPMVEGMMKKLRQSGEVVGAPKVHVVKEHDEFDYQLGDEERIVHKPSLQNRGKTIGAYSIVRLKSGDISREFMAVEEIEAIRRRGRSPDEGPWVTDFDEMARKTVFRRHYKKLPKSSDLDNVLLADDDTFVPYADKTVPGTSMTAVNGVGSTGAAAGSQGAQRRPAALEAVAASAGQPLPQQGVPERQAEPAKPEAKPEADPQGGTARDIL